MRPMSGSKKKLPAPFFFSRIEIQQPVQRPPGSSLASSTAGWGVPDKYSHSIQLDAFHNSKGFLWEISPSSHRQTWESHPEWLQPASQEHETEYVLSWHFEHNIFHDRLGLASAVACKCSDWVLLDDSFHEVYRDELVDKGGGCALADCNIQKESTRLRGGSMQIFVKTWQATPSPWMSTTLTLCVWLCISSELSVCTLCSGDHSKSRPPCQPEMKYTYVYTLLLFFFCFTRMVGTLPSFTRLWSLCWLV